MFLTQHVALPLGRRSSSKLGLPQGTWLHAEQVDLKDSEGNRSPSTRHTVGAHSMPAPPSFYALSGVFLWVTTSELDMLEINCSKISPQDD